MREERNSKGDQGPAFNAFDRTTWTPAEETYFGIVDSALEASENLAISNGKPQHAVYLLHAFLANTERTLRVHSGRLARFIDGGKVAAFEDPAVLDGAHTLLSRQGAGFQALIEADLEGPDHPLVELAKDMKTKGTLRGKLEIRKASANAKKALNDANFRFHWMVMDRRAFRLETDPERGRATVNFGDIQNARALDMAFNALWPHSTEVALVSR